MSGLPSLESQVWTAKPGQPSLVSQAWSAKPGQPAKSRGPAKSGQPSLDSQVWTVKSGQPSLVSQVTSHLDFCNSVLFGVPSEQDRLQRIQNNAAKLIKRKRKRNHVTSLFKDLHWLPINFRIEFKIATLAYCAHHLKNSLEFRGLLNVYFQRKTKASSRNRS